MHRTVLQVMYSYNVTLPRTFATMLAALTIGYSASALGHTVKWMPGNFASRRSRCLSASPTVSTNTCRGLLRIQQLLVGRAVAVSRLVRVVQWPRAGQEIDSCAAQTTLAGALLRV